MQTFTFGKKNRSNNFVVTAQEEETVNKELTKMLTKKQAIEYLVKRGWSTKAICSKIRYDDDRPLREQHVNQVKQRM